MGKIRQYEQAHNIYSSPNNIQENESRNDEMDWICSKREEVRDASENLKGGDHF
jgi:hypothetical protein